MSNRYTACGKVVDMTNYHTIVVIGCSSNNKIVIWDTAMKKLKESDFPCPGSGTNGEAKFKSLDDQHLVFTNQDTDMRVWEFNIVKGFKSVGTWAAAHGTGGLAVTNRGYAECIVNR